MPRLFRLLIAWTWLLPMTLVYAAAPPRILLVQTEEGPAHAEVVAALKVELADQAALASGSLAALQDEKAPLPDLVVAIGAAAFEGVLRTLAVRDGRERIPVLATLLPRTAYDATLARGLAVRRPVSAAVLDQPLSRQAALLARALPQLRRIAVLPGMQTRPLLRPLERELNLHGLQLVLAPEVKTADEIYPSLKVALDEADVILALPDATIYHGASLQNILLTTYRARKPLVGFTAVQVRAGAVLAVYSTPTQVAGRSAEMLRTWLAGRGLPPPQGPRDFSVVTNAKVADSLGLRLEDAATLAAELRREEGRP
jgi:hypothetical protein